MKPSRTYLLWTLGLLTAFGPYITDLYLSSLPEQVEYFSTVPAKVQLGLTSSMMGLAAGQLVIGPLSDRWGRRPLLLTCLAVFTVITVLAIFSADIDSFIGWRFLQGAAGASGIVLSRSMATDRFEGRDLVNAMGTMGSVNGIAPVTAPIIGAALASVTDWRGIFVVLCLIGAALFAMSLRIPETLEPGRRSRRGLLAVFGTLFTVFRDRGFSLIVAQQCMAFALLFGYIASSPFILQRIYGLSGLGFSLCFGFNALGIGLGAAYAGRQGSPLRTLCHGSAAVMCGSLLTAAALFLQAPLLLLEPLFFLTLMALGLTFPTASAVAMSRQRKLAGAASAVLGASGFVTGGIVSPLAGIGDIAVSTGIVLGAAGFGTWALAQLCRCYLEKRPEQDSRGNPVDFGRSAGR
ncbi:multidrug effflux MFS transporter [Mesosutterella sp. AGMB02718]|uniref:Bcr/CflA family efflux transporter n=1 Tax=Mesosutterella faecium TaxID=2925194 RepID=A0ABT7IP25_9BURK|nr:multidrug effflux MFS transporter [Mesosutterella sp. AGMB02718]MDL2059042.1 multidrug effflux MFS transporter [Mesosutterella sp. AGMB02718]